MNPGRQRKLAVTAVASGATFLVLLGVLHLLQPDLDPSWRFISEYARGAYGWLMSLAFAALGLACVASLLVFRRHAHGWAGRIGAVLLGISSAGMVLATVFVTDPINTPMDQLSASGTLHSIGGGLNFTPFAILALTLGLARNERWKSALKPLWTLVVICVLAGLVFAASAASTEGAFGPGNYTGLWGRLMMVSFVAWVICAGAAVIDITGRGEGLRPSTPLSATR